jgi:PiT family inorganic phosphate transporter
MATLVVIVALALVFDYINGFHDAANSIATVVSTRVLSPRTAVLWAAFFNFVAFLVFGVAVAKSISEGIDPSVLSLPLVGAGLLGAIVWNLITWWFGLPTSSSHALLGGLAGAAIAKAGFGALDATVFIKTGIFILVAPLIGFVLGGLLMWLMMRLFGDRPPRVIDGWFRRLQLVSAGLYSLGHGGNDAQKTAGIIVMALVATASQPGLGWLDTTSGGYVYEPQPALFASRHVIDASLAASDRIVAASTDDSVAAAKAKEAAVAQKAKLKKLREKAHGKPQLWIILLCFLAIGLGTLSGGWRIVKTMGTKITKLAPVGGFCAETGGAISLFISTYFGIPVSTTHTITGAIVGTGSVFKLSAVRWGVAGRIVWAWVLTGPAAAFMAALSYEIVKLFGAK